MQDTPAHTTAIPPMAVVNPSGAGRSDPPCPTQVTVAQPVHVVPAPMYMAPSLPPPPPYRQAVATAQFPPMQQPIQQPHLTGNWVRQRLNIALWPPVNRSVHNITVRVPPPQPGIPVVGVLETQLLATTPRTQLHITILEPVVGHPMQSVPRTQHCQ